MGDSTYFLHIYSERMPVEEDVTYAHVYDDLDGVTASAKRALKRLPETGQLTLKLIETDKLAGEDIRTVTVFTGDADIVATVLKKKLATERKQQNTQPAAPASTDESTAVTSAI